MEQPRYHGLSKPVFPGGSNMGLPLLPAVISTLLAEIMTVAEARRFIRLILRAELSAVGLPRETAYLQLRTVCMPMSLMDTFTLPEGRPVRLLIRTIRLH